MGFYSQRIFPYLLDWAMSDRSLAKYRQEVLTGYLNRNIKQLVENNFDTVTLEEFYGENTPKIAGYLYKGVATKAG